MLPHVAHRAPRRTALVAAVTLGVVAGCTPFGDTSDGDGDDPAPTGPVPATVTIPPVRLTPFCQAMIDLADRLEDDPPEDVAAAIIAAYEAIADEVPDPIRADFDAVLAELRGESIPPPSTDPVEAASTTTFDPGPPVTDASGSTLPPGDPFFEEGYDPDTTPAGRLNAYVDFECRDVANNPGPPPTQPLSDSVPTTDD